MASVSKTSPRHSFENSCCCWRFPRRDLQILQTRKLFDQPDRKSDDFVPAEIPAKQHEHHETGRQATFNQRHPDRAQRDQFSASSSHNQSKRRRWLRSAVSPSEAAFDMHLSWVYGYVCISYIHNKELLLTVSLVLTSRPPICPTGGS